MAIALANTTARPLGYGFYVATVGAAGPVPVDDYMVVGLRKAGTFPQPLLAYGRRAMFGFTTADVVIGVDDAGRYFPQLFDAYAAGGGIDVELTQFHANGTLVAGPVIYNTFTWDPYSQVGQLNSISASRMFGSNSVLERILAAVYRDFPQN